MKPKYTWQLTKGGPGSGYHGHAGRPGQVGGSSSGSGGSARTLSRGDLMGPDGQLKQSGPFAKMIGLVQERDGYATTYETDEKIEFGVEGFENKWYAWMKFGKGKQKGKKYVYLEKMSVPKYLSGSDIPITNSIIFRAEYPDGEWKQIY